MSGKTISLILLVLCHVVNLSQADAQNEQYSALDSFNLGYTNPYSSLSDTEAGAIQQPFNILSFNQPTLQYQKNHNGDIQEDDVSQVAGGRFLWTIYVTATKYRGTYLKTIYCTTSTAAISICTPSAGRRKRFSKGIRGLFYNDKEEGNSAIDDDANDQLHTFSIEK